MWYREAWGLRLLCPCEGAGFLLCLNQTLLDKEHGVCVSRVAFSRNLGIHPLRLCFLSRAWGSLSSHRPRNRAASCPASAEVLEGGRRRGVLHFKSDPRRHTRTFSGDAGADLRSRAGGVSRTTTAQPTYDRYMACRGVPLPNHLLGQSVFCFYSHKLELELLP